MIKPKKENQLADWKALSEKEKVKNSDIRVKSQFLSDKPSVKLQHTLIDIINYCNVHKITLIGIKFPLTAEYIKSKNKQSYNADKLLESKNIKVYDFTDVFLSKSEYFSNQDHLNELGGKKFSEILLGNKRNLAKIQIIRNQ
jgi:hypothetical protein